MERRMKNALAEHERKLAALESGPRPFTWQDAGSIAYHKDAIRIIGQFELRERQQSAGASI